MHSLSYRISVILNDILVTYPHLTHCVLCVIVYSSNNSNMANDIFIKAPLTDADFGPEPEDKYCYFCEEFGHGSDEDDYCLKTYEESDPITVFKETGL